MSWDLSNLNSCSVNEPFSYNLAKTANCSATLRREDVRFELELGTLPSDLLDLDGHLHIGPVPEPNRIGSSLKLPHF
jgi:hypothetical protein